MAAIKKSIATKTELLEQLQLHADTKDRSINYLINKAIEEYIINHKKEV